MPRACCDARVLHEYYISVVLCGKRGNAKKPLKLYFFREYFNITVLKMLLTISLHLEFWVSVYTITGVILPPSSPPTSAIATDKEARGGGFPLSPSWPLPIALWCRASKLKVAKILRKAELIPSKHGALTQCGFNVGPASETVGQR